MTDGGWSPTVAIGAARYRWRSAPEPTGSTPARSPFGPEAPGSIPCRRRSGSHQPPDLCADARRVLVPFIARIRLRGGDGGRVGGPVKRGPRSAARTLCCRQQSTPVIPPPEAHACPIPSTRPPSTPRTRRPRTSTATSTAAGWTPTRSRPSTRAWGAFDAAQRENQERLHVLLEAPRRRGCRAGERGAHGRRLLRGRAWTRRPSSAAGVEPDPAPARPDRRRRRPPRTSWRSPATSSANGGGPAPRVSVAPDFEDADGYLAVRRGGRPRAPRSASTTSARTSAPSAARGVPRPRRGPAGQPRRRRRTAAEAARRRRSSPWSAASRRRRFTPEQQRDPQHDAAPLRDRRPRRPDAGPRAGGLHPRPGRDLAHRQHRQPGVLPGAGRDPRRDPDRDPPRLPPLAPGPGLRLGAARAVRGRGVRVLRPDARRPAGAAAALEADPRRGDPRHRRAGRPAVTSHEAFPPPPRRAASTWSSTC